MCQYVGLTLFNEGMNFDYATNPNKSLGKNEHSLCFNLSHLSHTKGLGRYFKQAGRMAGRLISMNLCGKRTRTRPIGNNPFAKLEQQ